MSPTSSPDPHAPRVRRTHGVLAISVAADMVRMEVQNLRVYERRGLLTPDRTSGGTRLYSQADIEVLHRIRELLAEGLNIAGIARVLELEAEVEGLLARAVGLVLRVQLPRAHLVRVRVRLRLRACAPFSAPTRAPWSRL